MCREWELYHKLLTYRWAHCFRRYAEVLSVPVIQSSRQAQRTSILGNFLCMVFIVIVLSHSSIHCI